MKHVIPFKFFESEDLESLVRDLRNVGMHDFEWGVTFKNTWPMINEELEKDYVATWRSNSGAKVVKIAGKVDRYPSTESQEIFAQLKIDLSDGNKYTGRLSTGSDPQENYANLRYSTLSGYGPIQEKEFSVEEGRKIRDGEKLIMKEILPLIDKYPIK